MNVLRFSPPLSLALLLLVSPASVLGIPLGGVPAIRSREGRSRSSATRNDVVYLRAFRIMRIALYDARATHVADFLSP